MSPDSSSPSGPVSVMPQPCCSLMPLRPYSSIRANGAAAPPTPMQTMCERSAAAKPGSCASIRKLVGTPSRCVSPSARSLEQPQEQAGVEAAHHHVAAAGMEGRVGVDVQPAGMEGRQEHQVAGLRRQPDRHGALDAVEHAHLVGDLRALRPPGRARRVHDGPDVGEIERRRVERAARRGEPRLVGAGLAVGEVGGVRHARQLRHLQRRVGELLAMDQHHRARILGDELELGHREPPVQRQEDRSQPATGELQFEDVGVVHAEHRHAIALADAEGSGEPKGRTRHALVELGVGEAPAGGQVVRRLRPGANRA